jgi:hypothetical protein
MTASSIEHELTEVMGRFARVGTASEEELAPGGATADWTKAAPANGNQYYMIGAALHDHGLVPVCGAGGAANHQRGPSVLLDR